MDEKIKAGRGGARPGSGPKVPGRVSRHQVTLDDETLAIVRVLGNGNVSNGIRVASRIAAEARWAGNIPEQ